MTHVRLSLVFLLVMTAGGMIACAGGESPRIASASLLPAATGAHQMSGSSPIQHVIIVVQENRSFDNLFATFYGANGATSGYAVPMPAPIASSCAAANQPVIAKATSVPLTEVDLQGHGFPNNFGANNDLPHVYPSGYLAECDSASNQPTASSPCAMDGFDVTKFGPNGEGPQATCTYLYQYVNPSDITPYWDMAQQYVLADNTFQSQGSSSFTAHQDLIAAGTSYDSTESVIDNPTGFPWGCDANPNAKTSLLTIYGLFLLNRGPFPCFPVETSYPYETMRDLLDAKNVSWKFYANKVYPWQQRSKAGGSGIWSGFDAVHAVRYGSEWGTKVTFKDTKFFSDLQKGRLPAVSWITPNGPNSDHPAESSDTGPSWVASIVNAVGQSKYWKSSAVIVLWDDWGGYFDHVTPPFYDTQGGLGFRIPMLIISPYVQAHVEHTQYESTSVLKFVEDNWSLGSLGKLDQRATSIGNAFNFNMSPRKFAVIPAKYPLRFFLNQKPSNQPPDSE